MFIGRARSVISIAMVHVGAAVALLLAPAAQAGEDLSGKAVYERYCAVCHGVDGMGNGPMAAVLKPTATNLTLISKWNQGVFPYDRVYEVIDNSDRKSVV